MNAANTNHDDIPRNVKRKLMAIARRLPEGARSEFVRSTLQRLGEAAKEFVGEHPRMLVMGAVGCVLGQILDNILVIGIPFTDHALELTFDRASEVGLLAGAGYGFFRDEEARRMQVKVRTIFRDELRRAIDTE